MNGEVSGGATVTDQVRKVYVEPTTACNLACRTCVRHAWDEPEGFMAWPTYEAVVESLVELAGGTSREDGPGSGAGTGAGASLGPSRPRLHPEAAPTVAFMGLGEPLLHERFVDMVRLAKARGLRTEVTTNALLLDDEMAGDLAAAGLDQLVVSIDGASAESFGRVRSGASLARVVENVQRLHDWERPNQASPVSIGVEFVALRSTLGELPHLGRVAAQLGASFVIVSNVLPYTEELAGETLYDRGVTAGAAPAASHTPRWHLPRLDFDAETGAAIGAALHRAAHVTMVDVDLDSANARCPFVHADSCAVAWHGGVSPCPPLLHTFPCYVRGRHKLMTRWEVGRLPDESLGEVWAHPDYAAFRDRVRRFDFPPCTDCECELAEGNLEDCYGNPHPVCGDCLWARGVIRCA
ncbi:MAG TPA: radical SAM protein [Thermoleophilia bacterium]|nr:radical SAM protein [Thermoleophilia bacterium]